VNAAHIIAVKRDGHELTSEQIAWFIGGFSRGDIPHYQMSALAMAIYLQGMSAAETTALTMEMLASGVTLTWDKSTASYVDKHSTGGVGDKVSLVLTPLLACCGLRAPMISGRGLGSTGGTLDKLESIPGFRTNLRLEELQRQTDSVGCVITGATDEIAPADRKLYALRDVTATVASIPLITASIMSKKLAEGLDVLVLDVKFGSGAFMKRLEDARQLANAMVAVGASMGVKTSALLTDMNQPLGRFAGNAVEVNESIEVLSGGGPPDVRELTLALGAELLVSSGIASTTPEAYRQLTNHLDNGDAIVKFREMVLAQGGDFDAARNVAPPQVVKSRNAGYVSHIDTEQLGMAVVELGGGRKKVGDAVDHSVGVELLVRHGDIVSVGEPLVNILAPPQAARQWDEIVAKALTVSDSRPEPLSLIAERIG
jgi:pyrimidine-nucleoside phosphorylase